MNSRIEVPASLLANLKRNRFLRFLIVGASATLVQYLLLVTMVEIFNTHKVVASALSYGLAACYNYVLTYYFTFASRQKHRVSTLKYLLSVTLGVSINTACFQQLLPLVPHYLVAQFGATITTVFINFTVQKYWVFHSR